MALTSGAFALESPNRIRFNVTGGVAAGAETINLVTGAGLGGIAAASVTMLNGLLARAGIATTGETDAHVRSCLKATVRQATRTAPAAAVMGINCDLAAPAGVPTLTLGYRGTGAADDAALVVDLEINHSIDQ